MSQRPSDERISAYLDDELDPAEAAALARRFEENPSSAAVLEDYASIDAALRSGAAAVAAPKSLRTRLDRSLSEPPAIRRPALTRRSALLGGVAAAAAGAAVVWWGGRDASAMAPALFHDFTTRVAADRALDFPSPDLDAVAAWLEPRLPFVLAPPSPLEGVALRGARLCSILSRRFAAVHFEIDGLETCLYAAEAEGLRLEMGRALPTDRIAQLRNAGASGAFWRTGTLAFAVVGVADAAAVGAFARAIRSTYG